MTADNGQLLEQTHIPPSDADRAISTAIAADDYSRDYDEDGNAVATAPPPARAVLRRQSMIDDLARDQSIMTWHAMGMSAAEAIERWNNLHPDRPAAETRLAQLKKQRPELWFSLQEKYIGAVMRRKVHENLQALLSRVPDSIKPDESLRDLSSAARDMAAILGRYSRPDASADEKLSVEIGASGQALAALQASAERAEIAPPNDSE